MRSSSLLIVAYVVTVFIFLLGMLSCATEFIRCHDDVELRRQVEDHRGYGNAVNAATAVTRRTTARVSYVDAQVDGDEDSGNRGKRFVSLTTVDRVGAGVGLTDHRRTKALGYSRQLVLFERTKRPTMIVDVDSSRLERSGYRHEQALHSLLRGGDEEGGVQLRECDLMNDDCVAELAGKGYGATSSSIRCTYLKNDVLDETTSRVLIPRNRDSRRGWCLPGRLHTSLSNRRNCNPLTGNWILVSVANSTYDQSSLRDGQTRERPMVQLFCKCRYPNLMTQTAPEEDCDQPVGCRGGRLDPIARAGLVDPYANGRCICDEEDTYSSFDVTLGPICSRKKIYESSGELRRFSRSIDDGQIGRNTDQDQDNHQRPSINDIPLLSFEKISRQFLDLWRSGNGGDRGDLRLPDPCRLDTRTGRVISDVAVSCHSVYDSRLDAVVCKVTSLPVLTGSSSTFRYTPIKTSTDYLLNNHGRYDNGCMSLSQVTQ